MPHPSAADTDRPHPPALDFDLDRLVVLAGTFRDLPTDERERLAERLGGLHEGIDERLLLHTCHRAELVAVVRPGANLPSLPAWRGADAVERVLTVAAGLDSAIVAEEQLLGQVRDAYSVALARRETGPILNELMRRALRLGKRVRAAALPGGDRSLAQRALEWVAAQGELPSALVVGTGVVAREIAAGLAATGTRLTIASRSAERAAGLAASLPHGPHASSDLPPALAEPHPLVVLATRTAEPLLRDQAGNGLVVDLCAPSAVDGAVRAALRDRLVDLDTLGHATSALPPAVERRLRAELADERDRFVAWLGERRVADEIVRLREEAEAVRERHLARFRRRTTIAGDELAAVERMTGALVNDLLHAPTLRLRGGAGRE